MAWLLYQSIPRVATSGPCPVTRRVNRPRRGAGVTNWGSPSWHPVIRPGRVILELPAGRKGKWRDFRQHLLALQESSGTGDSPSDKPSVRTAPAKAMSTPTGGTRTVRVSFPLAMQAYRARGPDVSSGPCRPPSPEGFLNLVRVHSEECGRKRELVFLWGMRSVLPHLGLQPSVNAPRVAGAQFVLKIERHFEVHGQHLPNSVRGYCWQADRPGLD